jgi:hypothetical protein
MLSQRLRTYNNNNNNQTILKIELPKKPEITTKKTKTPNSPGSASSYAYGSDQVISSSPNTLFFINSLKLRLNKY